MTTDSAGIEWSVFEQGEVQLYTAVSARGLGYIGLPNSTQETMMTWLSKHYPGMPAKRNDTNLALVHLQLQQYFAGERKQFEIPLDFQGTPFQISVWKTLATIPYGQLWHYADVARTIGKPKAVRAVGAANGQNPIPIVVPCHRVIGSNGTLTGFRGGLRLKERLLQIEGVAAYSTSGHARFAF